MICRLWRGSTSLENVDACELIVCTELIPGMGMPVHGRSTRSAKQ